MRAISKDGTVIAYDVTGAGPPLVVVNEDGRRTRVRRRAHAAPAVLEGAARGRPHPPLRRGGDGRVRAPRRAPVARRGAHARGERAEESHDAPGRGECGRRGGARGAEAFPARPEPRREA